MIGERWQKVLYAHGDAVALSYSGEQITFSQLDRAAAALSTPPDHVLAQGGAAEIMVALVAGFRSGKPVHVVEKDRNRRVPACPVPAGTSLIKQTVGGSGHRRCQFFTGAQVLADVDRMHAAMGLVDKGVCVAAISPAHSYGMTITILQTLLNGMRMHWLPEPFPTALADAMVQYDHVFLPGIPALWRAWLMAGVSFKNVALAVSAGSPLTLELERRAMDDHGLKLHNLYGTSECGAVAYDQTDTLRNDAALVGSLLPGVLACCDADGVLRVQSDSTSVGYDEVLAGEECAQGCFKTSDLAMVCDGHLFFQRSIGKGINVAGRKLSPDEIAEKLRIATGCDAITVEGMASRDAERCEEVVAKVQLPPSALTMEFRQRASANLAPWEVPRRWLAVG